MFLEDSVHFRRSRTSRRLVQLPPIPIHLEHCKRPIDTGILQELLPIHRRLRTNRTGPNKQPNSHTSEDRFATHASPPLSTLTSRRPPPPARTCRRSSRSPTRFGPPASPPTSPPSRPWPLAATSATSCPPR